MLTKYNIIGDIHARPCWRNLMLQDAVNIFVGDYFDPYERISQAEQLYNFQEILAFKRQHPSTVLLYGNHDLHYLVSEERYSRYDVFGAYMYRQALEEAAPLFDGVAYPVSDKALVTHAGVTREWYEKYLGTYQSESLAEVARRINELWCADKHAFMFSPNATDYADRYGTSPTQSPLWIRPWILRDHDLFSGLAVKQIFGHTQTEGGILSDRNLICVDCLGTKERTYLLEMDAV